MGMGSATASPAGASTPTKLYACYSNTTDALSYLNYPTVKKCASGSTLISWNITGAQGAQGAKGAQGSAGAQGAQGAKGSTGSKGPQGSAGAQGVKGAQGAQGAQGAAGAKGSKGPAGAQGAQGAPGANGAVALYSGKLNYSDNSPPGRSYSPGVSEVVATLSPPAGSYAVNVDATVGTFTGSVRCHAFAHSLSGRSTSSTNVAHNAVSQKYVTVAMTGGMTIKSGSIIEVDCFAPQPEPNDLAVLNVQITATQVNTFTGEPNHAAHVRARPLNSFTTPLVPLPRADKIARRR
jgi:hypothetical protein